MRRPDLLFKQKALAWASSFDVCCVLDSNGYTDQYQKFDLLIAAGARQQLRISSGTAFDSLKDFYEKHQNWMFGLLGYDLKNEVENLYSENPDTLDFPDLFFFVPEHLIAIKDDRPEVLLGNPEILQEILRQELHLSKASFEQKIESRMSKQTYLDKVEELQRHIHLGNIYEVTFCQEFFAEHAAIDPLAVYEKLINISPTPFAGFFKIGEQYILSASPERFLSKKGQTLISQPIKGTARRGHHPEADQRIKRLLKEDLKEQTENVMIVDLVRNDLTKSALPGTVKVEELFGIYSFPQVHQMISTITCELRPGLHFIDAIRNTFPMGSMTGAPKIKAMELIEQQECIKRGAYSGSIGYINPDGDFDFNVVIRSILYQAKKRYLSFQVGGAITYNSVPEKEYEECILKASAIIETLKG
jgi:para-aminobenzoate synthetase component 1